MDSNCYFSQIRSSPPPYQVGIYQLILVPLKNPQWDLNRYTDIHLNRYTKIYRNIQLFIYTDLQVYRFTDVHIKTYSDIQMRRYTDVQVYGFTAMHIKGVPQNVPLSFGYFLINGNSEQNGTSVS